MSLFILFTSVLIISLAIFLLLPTLIISKDAAEKEFSVPASLFVQWRGARLHYIDEGHGFPILMIHGFGGSTQNFSKIAEALKGSYRVIRIDIPGFGLSDLPEQGQNADYVQMYRDYITFFLDFLGLDSLYIMGNSMGGGIAWLAAGDHPEKVIKLVLVGSGGYDAINIASKLTMFKYTGVGHIFNWGMPEFFSKRAALSIYADPEKMEPEVWQLSNHFMNREGNIQNMLALVTEQQFPDTELIRRVKCPTLIVWGKEDNVIPVAHAEKFRADIKNSEVIIYDHCGHVPMMECAEQFTSDFLCFAKAG
jgi:pimeloyl-ACP methyl ester carboxylesterase